MKLTTIVSDLHDRLRRFAYIDGLTGGTNRVDAGVVTDGGSGYTANFAVTATGGGGSGFTGTAVVLNDKVVSITVTNGGSGFTSTPTLDLSAGDGSGASATAVLAPTTLDAATTTALDVGHTLSFEASDRISFYELISSTDAESSPRTIRPDDYAASTNEKVWRIRNIQNPVTAFAKASATTEYPFGIQTDDATNPLTLQFGITGDPDGDKRHTILKALEGATPRGLAINPDGGPVAFGTDTDFASAFTLHGRGASNTVKVIDETQPVRYAFETFSNSAGAESQINLRRSRGTVASPGVPQAGDELGTIFFAGMATTSTSSWTSAAAIRAFAARNWVDGGGSAEDAAAYVAMLTSIDGGASLTNRMVWDELGNVGIGNSIAFGAGAVGVLRLMNGTQGAALADAIQIVSEDLSAGNTIPSIRTEGGGIFSAGTPAAASGSIAMKIDGAVKYFTVSDSPAS